MMNKKNSLEIANPTADNNESSKSNDEEMDLHSSVRSSTSEGKIAKLSQKSYARHIKDQQQAFESVVISNKKENRLSNCDVIEKRDGEKDSKKEKHANGSVAVKDNDESKAERFHAKSKLLHSTSDSENDSEAKLHTPGPNVKEDIKINVVVDSDDVVEISDPSDENDNGKKPSLNKKSNIEAKPGKFRESMKTLEVPKARRRSGPFKSKASAKQKFLQSSSCIEILSSDEDGGQKINRLDKKLPFKGERGKLSAKSEEESGSNSITLDSDSETYQKKKKRIKLKNNVESDSSDNDILVQEIRKHDPPLHGPRTSKNNDDDEEDDYNGSREWKQGKKVSKKRKVLSSDDSEKSHKTSGSSTSEKIDKDRKKPQKKKCIKKKQNSTDEEISSSKSVILDIDSENDKNGISKHAKEINNQSESSDDLKLEHMKTAEVPKAERNSGPLRSKASAKQQLQESSSSIEIVSSDEDEDRKRIQVIKRLPFRSTRAKLTAKLYKGTRSNSRAIDSDSEDDKKQKKRLKIKKSVESDSSDEFIPEKKVRKYNPDSWVSDEENSSNSMAIDSDSENDKRKKKRQKWEKSAESDSSDEVISAKKVRKYDPLLHGPLNFGNNNSDNKKEKKVSKKLEVSSSDDKEKSHKSSGISDSEEIDKDKKESLPKKSIQEPQNTNEEAKDKDDTPKKGRKNIYKILPREKVAMTTKEAQAAEKERKRRIAERRKLYNNTEEIVYEGNNVIIPKKVLEVDPDSKEEVVEIHPKLVRKLKPHQVKGVEFMWECTIGSVQDLDKPGSGCILAHCMGLGKTLQVITFLHTCLTNKIVGKTITRAMIICPYNTALNWVMEFDHWLHDLEENVKVHFLGSEKLSRFERKNTLKNWFEEGGVIILSYDLFRLIVENKLSKLRHIRRNIIEYLLNPGPDIVICDEGHILKNEKSAISLAINKMTTLRRIILTGTPLQNNLKEYHCMINFVKPNLLGTNKEFCNQFVNPITNGQYEDSNEYDVKLMKRRIHVLHKFLDGCVQRCDYSVLTTFLPPKHEYVINVRLSETQTKLYESYLDKLNTAKQYSEIQSGTLFTHFNNLRKIWTHPYMCQEFSTEVDMYNVELSGKMVLLLEILKECEIIGDKVLLFSQSLMSLDLIEDILSYSETQLHSQKTENGNDDDNLGSWCEGEDYFRMDGSTTAEFRKSYIDQFNDPANKRARLFLISTLAGSLGVNLVGANRVIIFDTSWNPYHDVQSMFRVYRFGQLKPVYIYRLLAHGTMEEKIYDRQVTKISMFRRVVDEEQMIRHFRAADLAELYSFDRDSTKQRSTPMVPKDRLLAELLVKHKEWIVTYHEHDSLLQNETESDLTEEERQAAWAEYENEKVGQKTQSFGDQKPLSGDVIVRNYQMSLQNMQQQAQLQAQTFFLNQNVIRNLIIEPDFTKDYVGRKIPELKNIISYLFEHVKKTTGSDLQKLEFKNYFLSLFYALRQALQEKNLKVLRIKQEYCNRGSVPNSVTKYLEELTEILKSSENYIKRFSEDMKNEQTKQQKMQHQAQTFLLNQVVFLEPISNTQGENPNILHTINSSALNSAQMSLPEHATFSQYQANVKAAQQEAPSDDTTSNNSMVPVITEAYDSISSEKIDQKQTSAVTSTTINAASTSTTTIPIIDIS